jgi:hypothetical protein
LGPGEDISTTIEFRYSTSSAESIIARKKETIREEFPLRFTIPIKYEDSRGNIYETKNQWEWYVTKVSPVNLISS